jgi:hypothetical protein
MNRFLTDHLSLVAIARSSGRLLLGRFVYPVVVQELLLNGRGNDDDFPLAAMAGTDQPPNPYLPWKAVLFPLPVPFQQFIDLTQAVNIRAPRRRHGLKKAQVTLTIYAAEKAETRFLLHNRPSCRKLWDLVRGADGLFRNLFRGI